MADFEIRQSVASCFGRLKDELTRDVIPVQHFEASIAGAEPTLYKEDGYFAFRDVRPPPSLRQVLLTAPAYRSRSLPQMLPAVSPVELIYPGEDELYVIAKTVNAITKRVTFDPISFVPTIPVNAPVIGEGGFSTQIANVVEGTNVSSATLLSVAGLLPNTVLRLVRSRHLVLRPADGYSFAADQTVVSITILDSADGHVLEGAAVTVTQMNATALATVTVGTVVLSQITLLGQRVVLGPSDAVRAAADDRGRAVFYYPAALPLTQLRISVSASGYVTQVLTFAVAAGQRTVQTVSLVAA